MYNIIIYKSQIYMLKIKIGNRETQNILTVIKSYIIHSTLKNKIRQSKRASKLN
jgi:hypothetical protein